MLYYTIPAQYLITPEYCYVQMASCCFFLEKIRNELVEKIDDANTDKQALYYAKNINDITSVVESAERFLKKIYDFMREDLIKILVKKSIWKKTCWYKNIYKTNDGYEIYDICLDQINTLKLQLCDMINKDFDLGLSCQSRILDGTLNDGC